MMHLLRIPLNDGEIAEMVLNTDKLEDSSDDDDDDDDIIVNTGEKSPQTIW
jgi:hypothetical protein